MPLHPRWTSQNPAVQKWGLGPEGAKCKTCAHLYHRESHARKRFLKCAKRGEVEGISRGPRTDHRAGWDACKKYELEKPDAQAVPGSTERIPHGNQ